MNNQAISFQPDWSHKIPPGYSIAEALEDLSLSQTKFSSAMDYSTEQVYKLVNGDVPINEDIAIRLERVLGIPASFWMNLESTYRTAATKKI